MANYDLGTIGFTIKNTGTNEAINGLNQVAQAANKVSPAAQRVIDSMKRLRETQRQVSQANEVVARSFTKLELDRAAQRMQGFEKALANTRGNMNNFGVVTQQVGYQVGDFLVQVQSGTNFMVALGQQATQLVGVLPMMNGLFGLSTSALVGLSAGLGIAIPLITAVGAYFLRSSEQADKANEAVKKYQQTLENLNSSLSETQVRLEAFRRGVAPDEMFEAALAIEELKRQLEGLLTTEISGLGDVFSRGNRIAEARALLNDMEKVLESLKQQNAEETRLEVAARLRANQKRDEYREQQKLVEEHAEQVKFMGQTRQESDNFVNSLARAYGLMAQTKTAAAEMANQLSIAANVWLGRNQAGGVTSGGGIDYIKSQYSMYGGGQQASRRAIIEAGSLYTPFPVPDGKSSRGGSKAKEQEDALQRLREQLALENELLGVSEAQERVLRALGDQRGKYSETEIKAITAEVEAYNQKLKVLEEQKQLAETFKSSMETAFMSVVEGTESAKDAFKSMAYEMIKELYRVLVVQRMVGSFDRATGQGSGIIGGIAGLLGFRESGGSVMANRPYIVGERGPELVIPRHSGTVMNANQTSGVLSGNGDITVQNNITVTGSDAAMVRAEVAKMIPQITNATKAAVIDAKQRGGQMAAAFR